jgi:hypothetical protein
VIDWLRRAPQDLPTVDVDGRMLPVVLRRLDHACLLYTSDAADDITAV